MVTQRSLLRLINHLKVLPEIRKWVSSLALILFCVLRTYFVSKATDYIVFLSVTRGDAGKDGKD